MMLRQLLQKKYKKNLVAINNNILIMCGLHANTILKNINGI
jgi:hypothetical protein